MRWERNDASFSITMFVPLLIIFFIKTVLQIVITKFGYQNWDSVHNVHTTKPNFSNDVLFIREGLSLPLSTTLIHPRLSGRFVVHNMNANPIISLKLGMKDSRKALRDKSPNFFIYSFWHTANFCRKVFQLCQIEILLSVPQMRSLGIKRKNAFWR